MSKEYRLVTLRGTGLTFTLSNQEDETADYQGYLTNLSGFYGGVGVSTENTQRTLGHGFFPQPSVRTGREMTLEGVMVFKDEQTRMIADRFLSGLLWDGEFGELEVTTDELTLTSRVKLGGEISHKYKGINALEVQIPLTAPDPFLYGPPRTAQVYPAGFGEGLVYPLFTTQSAPDGKPVLDWGEGTPIGSAISNAGNADAYPVMTVHGAWPAGFTINTGGKQITYPAPVTSKTPVRIDTRAGEVTIRGVDNTYRLTRREWPKIPPGTSIQPRISGLAPSEGWVDVTVSDTYI